MVSVYKFSYIGLIRKEFKQCFFVQKISVSDGMADDFSMQIFGLSERYDGFQHKLLPPAEFS